MEKKEGSNVFSEQSFLKKIKNLAFGILENKFLKREDSALYVSKLQQYTVLDKYEKKQMLVGALFFLGYLLSRSTPNGQWINDNLANGFEVGAAGLGIQIGTFLNKLRKKFGNNPNLRITKISNEISALIATGAGVGVEYIQQFKDFPLTKLGTWILDGHMTYDETDIKFELVLGLIYYLCLLHNTKGVQRSDT